MHYREVGNTGIRLSEIGFGCGGNAGLMVRGTAEDQRVAVERALELGINYFDEAPDYGENVSESNLGRILKELGVRPFLTTKVEVRAENLDDIADHVERSLDASLARLGVEYVDFLQIHNGPVLTKPELSGRSYTHLWIEDYLRQGGALDGLRRVQASGKARHLGFITRGNDAEAARRLIDTSAFSLINVSVNLLNPSAGLTVAEAQFQPDYGQILQYAAAHGVGAAIYSPLAGGLLSDQIVSEGRAHPNARSPRGAEATSARLERARRFRFLSKALDPQSQADSHDLAEAAIRFVLSLEGVTTVLGGFSDHQQVEQNVAYSGKGPLSRGNMSRIEEVWRGFEVGDKGE